MIVVGSDLLKGSDGASRGGPLGAEGRLGAARGERGSGLGDDDHDISGPSVGARVGWCDAAMHNEMDSKCRAGTSRQKFSHHGAPVGKIAPLRRSKLEIAPGVRLAFYAVLTPILHVRYAFQVSQIESGNSLFAIQNIFVDTKCASACVFRPRLLGLSQISTVDFSSPLKRPGQREAVEAIQSCAFRCLSLYVVRCRPP